MHPFSASCILDVVSRHYYPPPFSVLQQPFSTRSIFMSARRKECKIPNTFPKYYFQQTVNCDGLFDRDLALLSRSYKFKSCWTWGEFTQFVRHFTIWKGNCSLPKYLYCVFRHIHSISKHLSNVVGHFNRS